MSAHLVVACEACGCRMQLERELLWPQDIHIICHGCETPLVVPADRVEAWAKAQPVRA